MIIKSLGHVKVVVAQIETIRADDEAAHSKEDELYAAVLTRIAEIGDIEVKELAIAALATKRIEFERWCA